MNRTRKQWQKADADDLSKFANQAFHAITNAKADIEELHEENARLRAKVAALVEAGSLCADVLASFVRSDGDYGEAITAIKTMKAAIAAAQGGAK